MFLQECLDQFFVIYNRILPAQGDEAFRCWALLLPLLSPNELPAALSAALRVPASPAAVDLLTACVSHHLAPAQQDAVSLSNIRAH